MYWLLKDGNNPEFSLLLLDTISELGCLAGTIHYLQVAGCCSCTCCFGRRCKIL